MPPRRKGRDRRGGASWPYASAVTQRTPGSRGKRIAPTGQDAANFMSLIASLFATPPPMRCTA